MPCPARARSLARGRARVRKSQVRRIRETLGRSCSASMHHHYAGRVPSRPGRALTRRSDGWQVPRAGPTRGDADERRIARPRRLTTDGPELDPPNPRDLATPGAPARCPRARPRHRDPGPGPADAAADRLRRRHPAGARRARPRARRRRPADPRRRARRPRGQAPTRFVVEPVGEPVSRAPRAARSPRTSGRTPTSPSPAFGSSETRPRPGSRLTPGASSRPL